MAGLDAVGVCGRGASWGEKGYIRIGKGGGGSSKGVCGINMQPVYATASKGKPSPSPSPPASRRRRRSAPRPPVVGGSSAL